MRAIKLGILFLSAGFCSLALLSAGWITDFARAKAEAKRTNRYILLSFSGSDWCIPCIKTKKEIFETASFTKFADTNLVLVNADFPRLKKNELSNEQTKQNESLAEQFDKEGVFPFTLLLNADGKILKEWRGFPGVAPEVFVAQIKELERIN